MPKRLRYAAFVIALLAAPGAVGQSVGRTDEPPAAAARGTIPVLTVGEALERAAELDGETIMLKGWASVRFEDYGIWASREDHAANNWKRCISLLNRFDDRARNAALDGRGVMLVGVLEADIYRRTDGPLVVYLGPCNRTGIRFLGEDIKVVE